jgi:hypothetical protein
MKNINSKNLEKGFLKAISESFSNYNNFGARSNKKLIPIHKWLADIISLKLGKNYHLRGLGNNGEIIFSGKYYPKTLDIAILKNEKIITTISFKFITSNYKQNSNNYFENLLGETANIRRSGIGFAHLIVLRAKTPYYDKNRGNLRGKLKKIEILKEKDILKYIKLFKDLDFPHKPDVLGIIIVDIEKNKIFLFNLDELDFSKETKDIFEKELSLNIFIKRFIALCNLKS